MNTEYKDNIDVAKEALPAVIFAGSKQSSSSSLRELIELGPMVQVSSNAVNGHNSSDTPKTVFHQRLYDATTKDLTTVRSTNRVG